MTQVTFDGEVRGPSNGVGNTTGTGRAAVSLATFAAVPAGVPIRPERRAKPASRLQNARVVGPKEGDPFVDASGRIKVQFLWDRDGSFDEHSSCWIRMMTPSAHGDEGWFSAHKVGSEVLVDFIDGDIDRPVVIGALYNGTEKQPYAQPGQVSRSSWKVRSIPGGKGFNEITFENQAGGEQIIVHAQRDRTAHVLRNDTETIGANQTTMVAANQTSAIGASRTATVGADDSTTVSGNRSEAVETKEDVTVKKGRTHTVEEGNDVLNVTKSDREVNVPTGNHTRNVKLLDKTESDNQELHARYDIHVTGDRKVEVRQGDTVATFEANNLEVHAAGHVLVQHKSTRVLIDEAGKVTIDADPQVEVNCGGGQVLMGQGKVSVQAPQEAKIAVGQTGIKLSAEGWEMTGAKGKLTATTGIIEVTGMMIKLN